MNNFTFIKRANVVNSNENTVPENRIPHPDYNDDAVNGMLASPMKGIGAVAGYYTPSLMHRAKNRWNQPVAPKPSWLPKTGLTGTTWESAQRAFNAGTGMINDMAKGSYRVMKNYGRSKPRSRI